MAGDHENRDAARNTAEAPAHAAPQGSVSPKRAGSDHPSPSASLLEESLLEDGEITSSHAGPPLPDEAPPDPHADDGWEALFDHNTGAYYFVNRFTHVTQWENPRVPAATLSYGSYDRF